MVAQDPPAVEAALAPGPMRRPYVRLLAAGILAVMVGCGDDQDTPTEPTTTAPTTTTPANRAPQASQSIPDQTVLFGDDAQLDMGSYFTDPDGDTLTYEATSSNTHVATVSVSGSTVTLSTMNLGRANVRVTARDPDGRTAGQRFLVTVEQGGPAFEGEITNCEATGSVDPRVTIEGFVRARRRLVGVSVTGWVQSEVFEVGTVRLGEIRQGQRKTFRITGTSPIPLFSSFTCGASIRFSEAAASGVAESVEQLISLRGNHVGG